MKNAVNTHAQKSNKSFVVVGGTAPWVLRLPIPAMGSNGWGRNLEHLRRRLTNQPRLLDGLMMTIMEAKRRVSARTICCYVL